MSSPADPSLPRSAAGGISNRVSGGTQNIGGIQSTGAGSTIHQHVQQGGTPTTTPQDLLAAVTAVREQLGQLLAQQPDLLPAEDLDEAQRGLAQVEREVAPDNPSPDAGRIRRGISAAADILSQFSVLGSSLVVLQTVFLALFP